MGAAHCTVVNQTPRPLCVVTFNMADLTYTTYNTMYIIDPGDVQVVEANPDAIGLKAGVLYDARRFKHEFCFHRFTCQNDSILTVTSLSGDDIDYYGEGTSLQGKGALRESDTNAFNLAAETLQVDLARESDKHVPQAVQDVKRFVHSVKTKSEDVLTKVTGKEVSLDLPKAQHFPGAVTKSGQQVALPPREGFGSTHGGDNFSSGSSHSVGLSLSSRHPSSAALQQSSNNKPTSAVASTAASSSSSSSSTTTTNAVNARNAALVTPTKTTDTRAAAVSTQSPPAGSVSTSPEDAQLATQRWEAELERLKKEKRWEEEVERVRRERQERARLEEEMRLYPERFAPPPPVEVEAPPPPPQPVRSAPVADTGCSVCVIS